MQPYDTERLQIASASLRQAQERLLECRSRLDKAKTDLASAEHQLLLAEHCLQQRHLFLDNLVKELAKGLAKSNG